MNIVLVFPVADKETGIFIKNAFEFLGHHVVNVLDPKRVPIEEIKFKVLATCNQMDVDMIFMSRTPILIELVKEVKKLKNRPILTFWNVDAERTINRWTDLFPMMKECDIWFTKASGNIPKFKEAGLGNVHWLLEGIDPKVHQTPSMEGKERWLYDVSFLGALDSWHDDACDRGKVIAKLMMSEEFDINTEPAFREEASDVYYRTKINIGSNHFPEVGHAISARDFRIMGAGGFLLTNYVKGYEDFFTDGVELAFYETPEECKEKVLYYLDKPMIRFAMLTKAWEKTHRLHTFADRMKEVIRKCEEL